jgi:uncharacterized protein (DUF362 family)
MLARKAVIVPGRLNQCVVAASRFVPRAAVYGVISLFWAAPLALPRPEPIKCASMEGIMNRSTVALVRCDSYDADQVYAALTRGVELLGGLDRFVRSGERILLKPNILAGEAPEKAVTTHPAVLAGCVELFQRGGATVCFGDSPGLESPSHAAEKSGLREAGAQSGAEFVEFAPGKPLVNPHGKMATEFPIAQVIHECDGIVNLPKMKTHQLTRVTGAVKNLFGCIPGKRKALYHVQHQNVTDFCTLLTELNQGLRPRLHVMDGIVAMEGNGPRSGDPTPMRCWCFPTIR